MTVCEACGHPCASERGLSIHIWRAHGIKTVRRYVPTPADLAPVTCECGKVCKGKKGLSIHRAGAACPFASTRRPPEPKRRADEPLSWDDELDAAILAARDARDVLACPWCAFVAPDVDARNRHVHDECRFRRPPVDVRTPFQPVAHAGL